MIKHPTRKKTGMTLMMILVVSLLTVGCRNFKNHESVMQVINEANTSLDKPSEPVNLQTIPIVAVSEPYQGGQFYTRTRQDKIGRFPCSGCHKWEPAKISGAREMAHGDIVLNHGAVTRPDACDTCHNLEERDYLKGANNQKIDFNRSYQKCAQCHFRQEKDWIGGAHGKRINNWEGKRIVENCTSCHNPHSPRFKKRLPATYSIPDGVLNEPHF